METEGKLIPDPVQNTMILPLLARARFAEKYPGIFRDPGAQAAAAALGTDRRSRLYRMADHVCPLYGLRQDMLIRSVRIYLREYPEAVIVNLGSGLDTSFQKADNGRCRWVDLDLPEAAALRKKLIPCGERETILAHDAAETSWMDRIDGSRGLFVISGGALYYFYPEQVKKLFCDLAERFPGGGICFDCQDGRALRRAQKAVRRTGNTGAVMHFSVDDPEKMFRPWSERFGKIQTVSGLPRKYLARSGLPLGVRLLLRQRFQSGMMKFVEIRFRRENVDGDSCQQKRL